MNTAYLLIGGNLGERVMNLDKAKAFISNDIGKIINASSIYETASWGITEQPDFLNQVLLIETRLYAKQLLHKIFSIENKMGRVRTQKNASRIIDIDILFFNDHLINEPGLTIPHPEIQHRKFALIPMTEIAPGFVHPLLEMQMKDILSTSKDTLEVKLYGKR